MGPAANRLALDAFLRVGKVCLFFVSAMIGVDRAGQTSRVAEKRGLPGNGPGQIRFGL